MARRPLTLEFETEKFSRWTSALLADVHPEVAEKGLRKLAFDFLAAVIRKTPVDQGRARAGWTAFLDAEGGVSDVRRYSAPPGGSNSNVSQSAVAQGKGEGDSKTNFTGSRQFVTIINGVEYILCVHGSTVVETHPEDGTPSRSSDHIGKKKISQIEVGDRVLTQAGIFKPVRKVWKVRAPEGTTMVRIKARWRDGDSQVHEIVCSPNHEILVFRDGRNKWVRAGEVLETDRVYHRRKPGRRAGTGKEFTCQWCSETYTNYQRLGYSRKYCSPECGKAAGAEWHRGRKRSEESRRKMRETRKQLLAENPELHPSHLVSGKERTGCEEAVADFLATCGLEYEEQARIGSHWVDFLVPEQQLVMEADGAYWHQDQEKDIRRDREILQSLGPGWRIVHLHFFDETYSPELDLRPEENVKYVVVNPGPATFTCPDTFEQTEVLEVERFQVETGSRGPNHWTLYDLEVEGVRSYYANNFLVHNSLEYGGSDQAPAGMLRLTIREFEAGERLTEPYRERLERLIMRADAIAGW